ncbi:hypothetical protein [Methylibium petroleiphilum]
MKLGTLRFSRRHRAARARMAARDYCRGSQWSPAVIEWCRAVEPIGFNAIKATPVPLRAAVLGGSA